MAFLSLHTSNFHSVCGVLGTFLVLYYFVSYLIKERIYISEACGLTMRFTAIENLILTKPSHLLTYRRRVLSPWSELYSPSPICRWIGRDP